MRAYERLLEYVKVKTPSSEESMETPSSSCQFELAECLVGEMKELGIEDAAVDGKCYVYGTIPATEGYENSPSLGFIAHMDTVSEFTENPIHPVLHENYDGQNLVFDEGGRVLDTVLFPHLKNLKGRTLITSDGTTILGADDKAGIAEIMTALAVLQQKNIPHGDIRVAFTPDEEVGKGAKHFDVDAFDARWAYTVDGGGVGELEFENFNAASVNIKIVGNNVHPGTAKGVMVNALSLAARIHAEVPADESPEMTEGYEGFYHLASMKGTVERADMHYIIRDFDRKQFEARKRKMMEIAKKVGKGLHPDCYIELVIEDSYYNMREKVVEHPHILDIAQQAMRDCDIEPELKPIRGGTDGAQLSFMGLPCPNLFTGGYNYHGKHEFVTLEGMEKAVQVIVRIAELTAQRK